MLVQEISFQELLEKISQPTTLCVSLIKKSEDITNPVIKLANDQGGTVILGFDRSNMYFPGTPIGADWVHIVIKNDCQPEIEFKIKETLRAGKRALLIEVQEGLEKPYQLSGSSQPLPQVVEEKTLPKQTAQPMLQDDTGQAIIDDCEQAFSTEVFNELTRREKKALNYLKKNNSISNKEYREINKVSAKTAHNELSKMIALGFLKQQGDGRLTRYILISDNPTPHMTEPPADNINPATANTESSDLEESLEQADSTDRVMPKEIIDPEDENFMEIFDDGVDFIDKLSQKLELEETKKKNIPKHTKIPLFDFNQNNSRLTKTDLRAEGSLESHLPD